MLKFYGKVGFAWSEETPIGSGIWKDEIVERYYFGELDTRTKWNSSGQVNDNLTTSTSVSIMADPFANEHFSQIKYVEFMGTKWKVESAIPLRPRINLTVGGVWNGQTPSRAT